jgi:hypothetical protein
MLFCTTENDPDNISLIEIPILIPINLTPAFVTACCATFVMFCAISKLDLIQVQMYLDPYLIT